MTAVNYARSATLAAIAVIGALACISDAVSQQAQRDIFQELVSREPHVEQADHRIFYGGGRQQFGDLRLPQGAGPHPVAILIHGGGWGSGVSLHYMSPLAAALACSGVATWNIEFRRLGGGGAWPAVFRDVAAATDYLRELASPYQLDLTRVVATGHSSGGHLALWLAARERLPAEAELYTKSPVIVQGVVALAAGGAGDLRHFVKAVPQTYDAAVELLGGTTPELLEQRLAEGSPAELLPLGKPQVLISGDADTSVPMVTVKHYADLATSEGDEVKVVVIPGGEHFVASDPSDPVAGPAIREAILTQLGLDTERPDECFER